MSERMARGRRSLTDDIGAVLPVLPPRLALAEIVLLLVAPILLEAFWKPFPDLTTFNPHPYWGPVLLLSLQYGTVSGLLAAFVAIAGVVLIGLPEPDIGENHFAYLIRVWTQPLLWVATALLLGQFRMHQIEHRDELLRRVDDLQSRSSALATYATNLQTRCDALERRIAVTARPRSDAVLDQLAGIAVCLPQDLPRAFDGLAKASFPGGTLSLFALSPAGLELVAASGWPQVARWRKAFPQTDPMTRLIVDGRRVLSVLAADDEAVLANEGLVAIPVLAADGGTVIGMLKAEMLPSQALSPATPGRLAALAGAVAIVLAARQRAVAAEAILNGAAGHVAETEAAPVRRWRQMRWFTGGRSEAAGGAEPAVKRSTVAGS